MSTKGKPNTFFKGMKSDMDESLQPKDSYRYAKNIRVTSNDGDNVSIQPFSSDKLALTFSGESSSVTTNSLSYTGGWVPSGTLQVSTINDIVGILGGWDEVPDGLANILEPLWGPIPIQANIGEFNTDLGNEVSLTITIQTINGNQYVMTENITTPYQLVNYMNVPFDVDGLAAGIISQSDNGIIANVTTNGVMGTLSSTATWVFVNTVDNADYVSSFSVQVSGVGEYVAQNQVFLENILLGSLSQDESFEGELYQAIIQSFLQLIINQTVQYYNNQDPVEINQVVINNAEPVPVGLGLFEQFAESLGFNTTKSSIQILGIHSFSDQLIILGKWPLMGVLQQSQGNPVSCDVIVKVKQAPDGTFNGEGLDGFGDFVNFEGLGPLYTIYFVGDLEFSLDRKLKVTGSEESGDTRRIYFTDGTFPLKTMNVGLNPILYSPYANTPEYFNIFTPAIFSPVKVTGFLDGGALGSISYSYCYRYKTVDGRFSRVSPFSNPASLPFTPGFVESASAIKGASSGESTGKTMRGEIRNLDTRYTKIELIYVPYIDNSPAGPGIVFNEYPITNVNDDNDENSIIWKHTGNETTISEISIADLNANYISWDTCQAMETKDNRLFVGNLSNSIETVDADFRVASYNNKNQPHSYSGNPDLYHDLLYSACGIDFNVSEQFAQLGVFNEAIQSTKVTSDGDGTLAHYSGDGFYRYIKGPENPSDEDNPVLYDGQMFGQNQRRGILGAQSRYFDTINPDTGEEEGVRVTFRILDNDASAIPRAEDPAPDLDRDAKLLQNSDNNGTFTAKYPYYELPSAEGGYYNNYSNPLYNSNYVGYRRGEIYRFGLLFYDKVGSPMFVKPIGDIRMPEHSTEYITPQYSNLGGSSAIFGFKFTWPYYYQTSRDPKDHGFEKTTAYDNRPNSHACVLYPYFEVKLSTDTMKKIGGYSVVRVPRDDINRTIVTSGIFSRAIAYSENAEDGLLKAKLGNPTFPFWTELKQRDSVERFKGDNSSFASSMVYTVDSPDVCSDGDFFYKHASTDRIKLIESAFCQKQNVALAGDYSAREKYLNIELADRHFPGNFYDSEYGYDMFPKSVNMFAGVINRNTLSDVSITYNNETYQTGAWLYRWSNSAQPTANSNETIQQIYSPMEMNQINTQQGFQNVELDGDTGELGYFTKYYSKRVGFYPQYGLRDSSFGNGGETSSKVGQVPFQIGEQQETLRAPFKHTSNGAPQDYFLNNSSDENNGGDYESDRWFETKIHYAKILNPGDEIDNTNIPEESYSYKNAHYFTELHAQGNSFYNPQGNGSWYKYAENSRTIGIVLNKPGGPPVVRQCLGENNYFEGLVSGIGKPAAEANPGGHYSPEVNVVSIVKHQNKDTMYGGDTEGDFSRNIYQATGHFTPVNQINVSLDEPSQQLDAGQNGNHVFGGDTYVGYHKYKKTFYSDAEEEYATCFSTMVPLEHNFNMDLRHGLNYSNNPNNIPRYIQDDYFYNESFDSENNGLIFNPKPADFIEINDWPCTIAWSEQKVPGEFDDNYSLFPVNQVRDLDYTKGPITQMFLLSNEMYSLQHSGTCKLSINPRVLIPSEDGTAIQAATGSADVLERYDYLSDRYGCQHFHGLAVSDLGAYYYDDNNSKFLRLGPGPKGSMNVSSLGDSSLMQNYFNENKNNTINDSPLTINTYDDTDLPASTTYAINKINIYRNQQGNKLGGISIGYDPEYSEVLLTTMFEDKEGYRAPETIVYNEGLQSFTSFVSKTSSLYFNHKGRLYSVYNNSNTGLDEIYMSNGWDGVSPNQMPFYPSKYLNFGGVDYYIWDSELANNEFMDIVYKEPIELEMVINDVPTESKIFDKIQISVNTDTPDGSRYIYFRKFAFKGSANIGEISQPDTNILGQNYSNIDNLEPGAQRTWYSVKDALHFAPMRHMNVREKIRGTYANVKMTMGWGLGNSQINNFFEHPSGYGKIKSEKFNIFSVVPFFRASRI